MKRLLKNFAFMAGATLTLALILIALAAPLLAPFDPDAQDTSRRLEQPSRQHLLGLDDLGRDVLSRIVFGARVSLRVGFSVVLIGSMIGVALGAIAGYFGGGWDVLIMRVCDILLAFPGILLAIALVAVLGPSLNNVILALATINWVGYARLVRGQVLKVREMEYVTAARALGARSPRVILRHVLPNVINPVIVMATLGLAGAILAEAALSFLGLGVQPPTPSWGAMLDVGPAVPRNREPPRDLSRRRDHARGDGPELPRRRPDRRARSEVPQARGLTGPARGSCSALAFAKHDDCPRRTVTKRLRRDEPAGMNGIRDRPIGEVGFVDDHGVRESDSIRQIARRCCDVDDRALIAEVKTIAARPKLRHRHRVNGRVGRQRTRGGDGGHRLLRDHPHTRCVPDERQADEHHRGPAVTRPPHLREAGGGGDGNERGQSLKVPELLVPDDGKRDQRHHDEKRSSPCRARSPSQPEQRKHGRREPLRDVPSGTSLQAGTWSSTRNRDE